MITSLYRVRKLVRRTYVDWDAYEFSRAEEPACRAVRKVVQGWKTRLERLEAEDACTWGILSEVYWQYHCRLDDLLARLSLTKTAFEEYMAYCARLACERLDPRRSAAAEVGAEQLLVLELLSPSAVIDQTH